MMVPWEVLRYSITTASMGFILLSAIQTSLVSHPSRFLTTFDIILVNRDSYIEDGKNPDLFSKTFVEAVAGENQFTNGKVTAMKASPSPLVSFVHHAFRNHLRTEHTELTVLLPLLSS